MIYIGHNTELSHSDLQHRAEMERVQYLCGLMEMEDLMTIVQLMAMPLVDTPYLLELLERMGNLVNMMSHVLPN